MLTMPVPRRFFALMLLVLAVSPIGRAEGQFPLSNEASPLAVCQDSIRTATLRLATDARRALSACFTGGIECVIAPSDEACCAKAERRCQGQLAKLERAERRFGVFIANRRCAEVPFADIAASEGLGYERLAERCAALVPPADPSDLAGLVDCLGRLTVADAACDVGTRDLPRSPDTLACLGLLAEPRAIGGALDLTSCGVAPGSTPTPEGDPTSTATVTAGQPTTTPTALPSAVATTTPAPSATITLVPSGTATRTATPPPSATATRTATPLPTTTATRTATPSATATPAPSATPTPVPTVTVTVPAMTASTTPLTTATSRPATPTATVTATPVPVVTATRTATPVPTLTATRTATPLPVVTATRTATPVPTSTPTGPQCGNGTVETGENCDDGNTFNCDACPKDCRTSTAPVTCPTAGVRHAQRVHLQAPAGALLSGFIACIDYPTGVVSLPGTGNVAGRTSNVSGLVTLNDFNNAAQVTFVGSPPGSAQVNPQISFDLCTGSTAPAPTAFSCVVKGASNQGTAIDPPSLVECTPVAIP